MVHREVTHVGLYEEWDERICGGAVVGNLPRCQALRDTRMNILLAVVLGPRVTAGHLNNMISAITLLRGRELTVYPKPDLGHRQVIKRSISRNRRIMKGLLRHIGIINLEEQTISYIY